MSKITLDLGAVAMLTGAEPGAELCSPDGHTVGWFVPPGLKSLLQRMLADREHLEEELYGEYDLEDLKAADAEGGEYTMEDVMKLLEQKP